MTSPHTFAPPAATLALAVLSVAGCATSGPASAYTPITGIQISAADIVLGHGCGTKPGQVYKYVALVAYAVDGGVGGTPLTSGVFDCFADGIFSNLPVMDGGPSVFAVLIYAYDEPSFPNALDCPQGVLPCPGDDAAAVLPWEKAANWTDICMASQFQGVTSIAACVALAPSANGAAQRDGASENTD